MSAGCTPPPAMTWSRPGEWATADGEPVEAVDAAGGAAGGQHAHDTERHEVVQGGVQQGDGVERPVEGDLAPVGGVDQPGDGAAVHRARGGQRPDDDPGSAGAHGGPDVPDLHVELVGGVDERAGAGADQHVHTDVRRQRGDDGVEEPDARRQAPGGGERGAQLEPVGSEVGGEDRAGDVLDGDLEKGHAHDRSGSPAATVSPGRASRVRASAPASRPTTGQIGGAPARLARPGPS